MTSNQLKKLAESYGLDLKLVARWDPPEGDDLRPLIAMPNIPRPLHGRSCQPRTILRPSEWDAMRKACYEESNDTCEICGEKPENLRNRHGHEVFRIDYEKGTSEFVRVFCVCYLDHIGCIHTGRALTLYSQGNPLFPAEFLLAGAEKAFAIISSYNHDHPEQEPVRLYSTWIEYLKYDELREPMLELMKKYDAKFYMEDSKKTAPWGQWRLVFNGEEYPTPYKNEKEWKKAMEEAGKNDTARIYGAKKKKFESLDSVKITDDNIKAIERAKVPKDF